MTTDGSETLAQPIPPEGDGRSHPRRHRVLSWTLGLLVVLGIGIGILIAIPRGNEILNQADREFLWDVEHHVAVLSQEGLSQLSDALRDSDADELAALLGADFTGQIPDGDGEIKAHSAAFQADRWQEGETARSRTVNAEEFVTFLMEQRSQFDELPGISISPMALAPIDRASPEGAWQGKLRLVMSSPEESAQPCQIKLFLRIGLPEPTLATLVPGGWLNRCEVAERVFTYSDAPLMRDVTSEWGVDADQFHDNWTAPPHQFLPTPGGVYVWDYNRDAILDFLVTDLPHPRGIVLYAGQPDGGFTDVTQEVGLTTDKGRCAIVADLDNDGWEDLLFGTGRVYHNIEGQRFEEVSLQSSFFKLVQSMTAPFTGAAIADFDRDGLIDLYLFRSTNRPDQGSWLDGNIADDHGNQLLRNLGDFQFEDVTETAGVEGGKRSTFTSVWLDADEDGWPDLYVINEFGNGVLLVNQRDLTFREHSLVDEPADFGSMGMTCGDFNNDGRPDIYVASMYSKSGARVIGNLPDDAYPPDVMHEFERMVAGSQLYENTGGLSFQRRGDDFRVADIGWAYGPSMLDLDNDGWLDLFATTGFISRTHSKPDG